MIKSSIPIFISEHPVPIFLGNPVPIFLFWDTRYLFFRDYESPASMKMFPDGWVDRLFISIQYAHKDYVCRWPRVGREGTPSRYEPLRFAMQHRASALQYTFYIKTSKVFNAKRKISNKNSILFVKIFDFRNTFFWFFF